MANENLDQWKATPAVINETVMAAKQFLDKELAKYETWAEFKRRADNVVSSLFLSQESFAEPKGKGVGRETLQKFLGGNWKQTMIQSALVAINDKTISRAAMDELPTMGHAKEFRLHKTRLICSASNWAKDSSPLPIWDRLEISA